MRYQVTALAIAGIMAAGSSAWLLAAQDDSFTLSAIVVDRDGVPVRNLTASDFSVTENGKAVPVSGVSMNTLGESAERGRAVALVLAGDGPGPELTARTQAVARDFINQAGSRDHVAVVRYASSKRDEVAGTKQDMLMRVAEYRAPQGAPLNARTPRDVLDLVAKLSTELSDIDVPRRAIVFIGSPYVYDIQLPPLGKHELEWNHWVAALTAAAKANVSVYVIDPVGLRGPVRLNPDGLIAQTGGTVFYNRNDLDKAVELVWGETRSYYALEYAPTPSREALQNIKVSVSRPDVTVRARRSR